MKVLISGASGLVGSALTAKLQAAGHEVVRLVRTPTQRAGEVYWNIDAHQLNPADLQGVEAVVNLAGDGIATGRWTAEKKAKIKASRINATQLLVETILQLNPLPQVLVSASAVGVYGSQGDTVLSEDTAHGSDFLANVAETWEAATQPASAAGMRVVNSRFGIILSQKGGALAQMLPPFQFGVGGPMGSGKQFMSWVALDDVVGSLIHALTHSELRGPINVVSPNPVRNSEFSHALGKVLFRPSFAPVPGFAVKLLFGEMGDALLLASQRAEPTRLLASGYTFQYPNIEGALQHLLKPGT